jgi:hypothetical protein
VTTNDKHTSLGDCSINEECHAFKEKRT